MNKLVPVELIDFLLGKSELDGKWFGDDVKPKFWWRKLLMEASPPVEDVNGLSEQDKVDRDVYFYGQGYMVNGKHIPLKDIVISPPVEAEPVAWMSSSGSVVGKSYKIKRTEDEMSEEWWNKHFKDYSIPLYTSPPDTEAKLKRAVEALRNVKIMLPTIANALAIADAVADNVPTKAQELTDSPISRIGKLINMPDLTNSPDLLLKGYQEIQLGINALRNISKALKDVTDSPKCPYCTSDNTAIRETYFDQTCAGCVSRMSLKDIGETID